MLHSRAVSTRGMRCIAVSALIAGLLMLVPTAQGRQVASLSLIVNFSDTGAVSVTLPNGTPVGTTSGTATVIPAGFYTLVLNGPGECINLPLLELNGPGVNIQDDMIGGETDTHNLYATFLPNSTYTWHLDRSQSVVHTFRTSADVVGTDPAGGSSSSSSSAKHPTPTSQDIAGSAILPFRGVLTGAVSAAGRLTFAYKGKSVATLKVGRYTVAVTDKSSTNGFMLQKIRHATVSVTGKAFVGIRTASVNLTAGKWLFMPRTGKTTYSIVVS
jgi:hypothetical protein